MSAGTQSGDRTACLPRGAGDLLIPIERELLSDGTVLRQGVIREEHGSGFANEEVVVFRAVGEEVDVPWVKKGQVNHEERRRIGIVASQESSNVVSQERLVDAGRDGCVWKRVNVEALLMRETKSVKEFGKAGIAQLGLAIVAHVNHHPRSRTARDETEGVRVVGIIEDDQPKLGEDRDVAVACAYAG